MHAFRCLARSVPPKAMSQTLQDRRRQERKMGSKINPPWNVGHLQRPKPPILESKHLYSFVCTNSTKRRNPGQDTLAHSSWHRIPYRNPRPNPNRHRQHPLHSWQGPLFVAVLRPKRRENEVEWEFTFTNILSIPVSGCIPPKICYIHCNWVYIQNIWALEFTNDLIDLEVPTYPHILPTYPKKGKERGPPLRPLPLAAAGCCWLTPSPKQVEACHGWGIYKILFKCTGYHILTDLKSILYARQLLQLSKVFALILWCDGEVPCAVVARQRQKASS